LTFSAISVILSVEQKEDTDFLHSAFADSENLGVAHASSNDSTPEHALPEDLLVSIAGTTSKMLAVFRCLRYER